MCGLAGMPHKPCDAALGRGRGEQCLSLPTPPCRSPHACGAFELIPLSAGSPLKSGLSGLTSISGGRNGRAFWSGLKALLLPLDSFPVWFVCINRQVTFLGSLS